MKQHEQLVRETDYQQGKKDEIQFFDKLTTLLGKNFHIDSTHRYSWYDYKLTHKLTKNKYAYELKCRNDINKNTYDTTIIPASKIKKYIENKDQFKNFVFIFSFLDGDYYIKLSQIIKLMKKDKRFKFDYFQRHKGFSHSPKKHLFIPVEYLQPLQMLKA